MEEENFVIHLWALVNEKGSPVSWEKSGTKFSIDFDKLDNYLQSGESIFSAQNQTDFAMELLNWGFRRTGWSKLNENKCMEINPREIFTHKFFKRNNPNLLTLIAPTQRMEKNSMIFLKKNFVSHMRDKDLCFCIVHNVPRMERELNNLQTVMDFEKQRKNLQIQVQRKKIINFSMGSMPWNGAVESENTGNENSVYIGDIAGSYGIVDTNKLKEFFGSCIPTYVIVNSEIFISSSVPERFASLIGASQVDYPKEVVSAENADGICPEEQSTSEVSSGIIEVPETKTENSDLSLNLQETFDVLNNY
ncbi:uncharacterized protein LOC129789430 [Lutzomyia longipalpis]|uniref:uncharacterized protein LOC129789430 n=1 Tax=Lutzomyia longipalpis TaxID=7200 RepID=UPI0024832ECA|nr:uncharacterized protein LOC129789430 [Lutzomyia longipalpis]